MKHNYRWNVFKYLFIYLGWMILTQSVLADVSVYLTEDEKNALIYTATVSIGCIGSEFSEVNNKDCIKLEFYNKNNEKILYRGVDLDGIKGYNGIPPVSDINSEINDFTTITNINTFARYSDAWTWYTDLFTLDSDLLKNHFKVDDSIRIKADEKCNKKKFLECGERKIYFIEAIGLGTAVDDGRTSEYSIEVVPTDLVVDQIQLNYEINTFNEERRKFYLEKKTLVVERARLDEEKEKFKAERGEFENILFILYIVVFLLLIAVLFMIINYFKNNKLNKKFEEDSTNLQLISQSIINQVGYKGFYSDMEQPTRYPDNVEKYQHSADFNQGSPLDQSTYVRRISPGTGKRTQNLNQGLNTSRNPQLSDKLEKLISLVEDLSVEVKDKGIFVRLQNNLVSVIKSSNEDNKSLLENINNNMGKFNPSNDEKIDSIGTHLEECNSLINLLNPPNEESKRQSIKDHSNFIIDSIMGRISEKETLLSSFTSSRSSKFSEQNKIDFKVLEETPANSLNTRCRYYIEHITSAFQQLTKSSEPGDDYICFILKQCHLPELLKQQQLLEEFASIFALSVENKQISYRQFINKWNTPIEEGYYFSQWFKIEFLVNHMLCPLAQKSTNETNHPVFKIANTVSQLTLTIREATEEIGIYLHPLMSPNNSISKTNQDKVKVVDYTPTLFSNIRADKHLSAILNICLSNISNDSIVDIDSLGYDYASTSEGLVCEVPTIVVKKSQIATE